MTPEHLLLDCQEPHRRHSGPDRHGREPEIARAGYAACPRNPISELVDSGRTEEFDRSMRTATCDTNFASLQLPRQLGIARQSSRLIALLSSPREAQN